MGRQALVTANHVKAAVEALRANGDAVTSRAVHEKLGKVGSMGTVHKLLQQCLNEKGETPDSLRQLPSELQQVILEFADIQADGARRQIAEELGGVKQEMVDLAEDNERLADIVEDLREHLARAKSERSTVEGRVMQLVGELAGAREEAAAERHAAEAGRVELAKLQLRVEALAPLEGELREEQAQFEAQRSACACAEQAAAVLAAQKVALDNQVHDLKDELGRAREACDRHEKRIKELSELVDRERDARSVAERELAVANAMRHEPSAPNGRGRQTKGKQAALWQADGQGSQVSPET